MSNQVNEMARLEADEARHKELLAPKGESTYTVQVERTDAAVVEDGREVPIQIAWVDVATIKVPARTHRKRLITKALMDAGITPEPGKPAPRVRVLDEESAFVHEPEAKQPPAEWVVS